MKKQRHIQTTRTLLSRFRYWGRKNYAAFASMGREFQIGHLHTNVVDVVSSFGSCFKGKNGANVQRFFG